MFRYERFVVALEEASRDMLPVLKNKALKVGFLFTFLLANRLQLYSSYFWRYAAESLKLYINIQNFR